MRTALGLYRAVTGLFEPAAGGLLGRRAGRGKEDPQRIGERLGRASVPRPEGPLAWLHGVSVGEALSLLPLVERLREDRPELNLLVTSGTLTSAELLARRLPGGVLHQFAPVDAPRAVARFLDHWRPDLGVFVESELWPNLILGAKARGVKLALVSARITERSARGWRRLPGAAKTLLGGFDLVLSQDEETDARLSRLGRAPDGRLNLKYAGEAPPFDPEALAALEQEAGSRPVLLAASTHEGEEELVLEAFSALQGSEDATPLLVIAPRHPERGEAVAELSRDTGFNTGRAGEGDSFSRNCDVFIADRLGELGLWFRLARSAFLGGSLRPRIGGHNPLEAVLVGAPVVSGDKIDNWTSVYADLQREGVATLLADSASLTGAWQAALDAEPDREAIAAKAEAVRQARRREFESAVERLEAMLP